MESNNGSRLVYIYFFKLESILIVLKVAASAFLTLIVYNVIFDPPFTELMEGAMCAAASARSGVVAVAPFTQTLLVFIDFLTKLSVSILIFLICLLPLFFRYMLSTTVFFLRYLWHVGSSRIFRRR
ncbi:hypothetical protein [Sphingobacterium paludis]|uniref:hypothetical protein n=1 Tax=Sphingobacterium paludis TaxID=1476465 RepID=UPI0010612192|nr:hypothetical protein [Sphingobacterium paludis]